jgi:hypothetical protein
VDTVIFHVNALTGEDVLGNSPADTILRSFDIISGPLLGAFPLPGVNKAIVLIDESLQVRITALMSHHMLKPITGVYLP